MCRRASTRRIWFPNTGLLPAAVLAQRIDLAGLVDARLRLARHGANSGAKALSVVGAVLAGGDSIDDVAVLRAGAAGTARQRHHLKIDASLLIRHGESVKVVQARLGHATAAETLDTYSHLWPDSEDRTREAIDAVLGVPAEFLRTDDAAEREIRRSHAVRGTSRPVRRAHPSRS